MDRKRVSSPRVEWSGEKGDWLDVPFFPVGMVQSNGQVSLSTAVAEGQRGEHECRQRQGTMRGHANDSQAPLPSSEGAGSDEASFPSCERTGALSHAVLSLECRQCQGTGQGSPGRDQAPQPCDGCELVGSAEAYVSNRECAGESRAPAASLSQGCVATVQCGEVAVARDIECRQCHGTEVAGEGQAPSCCSDFVDVPDEDSTKQTDGVHRGWLDPESSQVDLQLAAFTQALFDAYKIEPFVLRSRSIRAPLLAFVRARVEQGASTAGARAEAEHLVKEFTGMMKAEGIEAAA